LGWCVLALVRLSPSVSFRVQCYDKGWFVLAIARLPPLYFLLGSRGNGEGWFVPAIAGLPPLWFFFWVLEALARDGVS